jgi:Transposase DDE domain
MSSSIIPFPAELRPRLPTIVGNVDYLTLRQRLEQIDSLLLDSGLQRQFVERALQGWLPAEGRMPSAREQQKFQERCRRALRCTILRTLLQEDYRGFSCQLAGNPLYQWFCWIDALDQIRVPSKSELQRYAHWLPAADMRELINDLLRRALDQSQTLRLREPLDLEAYFLDTTALKANIHVPVDWVLLRDGVRTLMKATTLIRNQGLKGRMEPPQEFLRRINRLSIEMTHQRRTADSRKGRKRVLRQMKKLVKVVRNHARRHRHLLDENWSQTPWSRRQAEQILRRIDRVLELLPPAQQQAHERIIGGRLVDNREKILSLYEPDVHVIVRGKAGAEVEFGNTVLVGENRQGLIVDFQVYQQQAPADAHLLVESLERVQAGLGRMVGAVAADRGFAKAINHRGLEEAGIFNAICPRQPQQLKERMKEMRFVNLQRRRSQTEARIGILKNGFLGRPMRAKGFAHRQLALAWGVLTHNLWMLARLRKTKRKAQPLLQAA